MSDIARLREEIKESGMTMVEIARRAGIERVTLYNRLAGSGDFTAHEIIGLTRTLKLTKAKRDEIFLS